VVAVLSGGLIDPGDLEGGMQRLIAFLAAGLRAPLVFPSTTVPKTAVPEKQEMENVRS
jgi:hypothetical protein